MPGAQRSALSCSCGAAFTGFLADALALSTSWGGNLNLRVGCGCDRTLLSTVLLIGGEMKDTVWYYKFQPQWVGPCESREDAKQDAMRAFRLTEAQAEKFVEFHEQSKTHIWKSITPGLQGVPAD